MHGLAPCGSPATMACPDLESPTRAVGARLFMTGSARPGRIMRRKDDEVRRTARAAG